jgi:hypothetical protein
MGNSAENITAFGNRFFQFPNMPSERFFIALQILLNECILLIIKDLPPPSPVAL